MFGGYEMTGQGDVDQYSGPFDLYEFDFSDIPREPESSDVWKDKDIIPTLLLENLLCRSDLKLGHLYGDHPLTALLATLRNYHKATNHGILKYYYGLLCVRCITHVICLQILSETQKLDGVMKSLGKDNIWNQINEAIYRETVSLVSSTVPPRPGFYSRVRLESVFGVSLPLAFVGGITAIDVSYIANLLWEDRASFFALCSRGHLSGCTALLFTIYQIVLTKPVDGSDIRLLWLWDLSIRRYLVASHLERRVLRDICLHAMQKSPGVDVAYMGEVVPEDACALADAYTELLVFFYDDDQGDLSIMEMLYRHVSSMLRRNASTQAVVWDILKSSVKFLWLVCSKTRDTPRITRTSIRMYAAMVFDSTSVIQEKVARTDEEKLNFARMVEEIDLLALAGRVLLLTTERGAWSDTDLRWDWSTEVYAELRMTFDRSISIAPYLFSNSIFTWAKVYNHIQMCYEMSNLNSDNHRLMTNAWAQLGTTLGAQYSPPSRKCEYPRCFQGWTNETVLGVRHTCGRCGAAEYCNSTCQRSHWQLRTVDSHTLKCLPLKVAAR
ncbi:hypothetical protein BDV93DRAFT_609857 [Ceratobasidium sp. AG-I]|nr:hypothetical protein BDV93DRAFT_609857 [Ceratobasidium sp. AG-I]